MKFLINFNRINRGRKGSAMMWAITSLLILSIIIFAVVGLSVSHNERSLQTADEHQAYLTARSAVDMILAYMDGYSLDISAQDQEGMPTTLSRAEIWARIVQDHPFIRQQDTVELTDFYFGPATEDMGRVESAKIRWIANSADTDADDEWVVEVTAGYGGARETVTARLALEVKENAPVYQYVPETIEMEKVFHGFYVNQLQFPSGYNGLIVSDMSQLRINDTNAYIRTFNRKTNDMHGRTRELYISAGKSFYTAQFIRATDSGDRGGFQRTVDVRDRSGSEFWVWNNDCVYLSGASGNDDYRGSNANFGNIFAPTAGLKDDSYCVQLNGSPVTVTTVTSGTIGNPGAAGNYFYRVRGDVTLNLSNLTRSGAKVYIFVESGTLTLRGSNNTARAYIYGAQGAQVYAQDNNTVLNGTIVADRFEINDFGAFTGSKFTLNYEAPAGSYSIALADGGTEVQIDEFGSYEYRWRFSKYE